MSSNTPTPFIRTSTLSYISRTASLTSPTSLSLGGKCLINNSATVGVVKAGRGVVIGENCKIGGEEEGEGVIIGKYTYIGSSCVIPPSCTIGSSCLIGPNVTLSPGLTIRDCTLVRPGSRVGFPPSPAPPPGLEGEVVGGDVAVGDDGAKAVLSYPPCVVIGREGEIETDTTDGFREEVEWICREGWGRVDEVIGGRMEVLIIR